MIEKIDSPSMIECTIIFLFHYKKSENNLSDIQIEMQNFRLKKSNKQNKWPDGELKINFSVLFVTIY